MLADNWFIEKCDPALKAGFIVNEFQLCTMLI